MGSTTDNPRINLSLLPAEQAATIAGRRDLITGQLGSSATLTTGVLTQNVQNLTDAEIRTQFGANVDLTYKILNFRAGNDRSSQLDVIGVDPAAGTAGTAVIGITGTATATGTYKVSVVDKVRWSYEINIASGTTDADAAIAIEAGVAALSNPVFTSGVATTNVTYTSTDLGTISDSYGISVEGTVPGLVVTITGWTGGATDPTVTSILDPIVGIRYNGLQWPEAWSATLTIPVDELDSRFNAANEIMDGVCFTGFTDTFANSKAATLAQNSQSLSFWGNSSVNESDQKGTAIMQPADWVSCYFMGLRSKRLSDGALISGDVTTFAPRDSIGGKHSASLPYFNSPLRSAPVTDPTFLFDKTEQGELEESGFTTFGVNKALNGMITGAVVTTWTTDSAGNPNTSFLYLNYVDTGSVCREFIFKNLKADYAQTRLTEGELVANLSITNAGAIKGSLLRYYKQLSNDGLTQKGPDAEQFFSDSTTVVTDLAAGTVTIIGPLPIVTGLRQVDYPLSLSFSIN